MHDGDVGFGWWLVMTLGMAVFWGGLIALVVCALRAGGTAREIPSGDPPAREILDRRLADGSIDVDEYERRRRLLDEPKMAASGGRSG